MRAALSLSHEQQADIYQRLHDAYITILYEAIADPCKYQPEYVLSLMRLLDMSKLKEYLFRANIGGEEVAKASTQLMN